MTTLAHRYGSLHTATVHKRRVRKLVDRLAPLLPSGTTLDVGCGDGEIAAAIMRERRNVRIEGVDVLVRPDTSIPVRAFDGTTLPYESRSVDAVLFTDVLHHIEDAVPVLREAGRVTRGPIIIKDVVTNGFLAFQTLAFMDWVGNAPHGVACPNTFWSERRWRETIARLGWTIEHWDGGPFGLYPFPANLLFERQMHLVARLMA